MNPDKEREPFSCDASQRQKSAEQQGVPHSGMTVWGAMRFCSYSQNINCAHRSAAPFYWAAGNVPCSWTGGCMDRAAGVRRNQP